MISLCKELPKTQKTCVETLKINCTYNSYKDIALFWIQDNGQAVISLLDGNMVIYNNNANLEELREFINVISPQSVFSDEKTLEALFGQDFYRVSVMQSNYCFNSDLQSDVVNSYEIYKLLDVKGLKLPPYEHFAVDFCHRLNHGNLKYFALKNLCAAVCISDGQAVLLNGIASHQKGMGSVALCGALSQYSVPKFAVCDKSVENFYLKNKFSHSYDAGYWRNHF